MANVCGYFMCVCVCVFVEAPDFRSAIIYHFHGLLYHDRLLRVIQSVIYALPALDIVSQGTHPLVNITEN